MILDGSRAIPSERADSSPAIFRVPREQPPRPANQKEEWPRPTVSATPFRKSRRVISRRIPSSRSFRSFIGKSFIESVTGPRMRTTDGASPSPGFLIWTWLAGFVRLITGYVSPTHPDCRISRLGVLRLLHCRFGSLESNTTMVAVTKWFGYRPAATAERESRLAGQVVLVAVGVDQFNRPFGCFHPVRTVFPDVILIAAMKPPGILK